MRGYSVIALENVKDKHNVGSVIRAAQCYGAAMIVVAGGRVKTACTDTMKGYRSLPVLSEQESVFDCVPYDCVPVAVELCEGAESLIDFKHPERAFYIFGPEDGSVKKDTLQRCKHRIMVPTKHCMNLAATVNVVLYDRLSKG